MLLDVHTKGVPKSLERLVKTQMQATLELQEVSTVMSENFHFKVP